MQGPVPTAFICNILGKVQLKQSCSLYCMHFSQLAWQTAHIVSLFLKKPVGQAGKHFPGPSMLNGNLKVFVTHVRQFSGKLPMHVKHVSLQSTQVPTAFNT